MSAPSPMPASRRQPGEVRVVCYHRVLPRGTDDAVSPLQRRRGTVVDLEVFEQHLDAFHRQCSPIGLGEYLDWLDGRVDLPANALLVTFDDGYRDFGEYALPALEARRIPCVLFATLCAAEGESLLPVDRLYLGLERAQARGEMGSSEFQDWLLGDRKRAYVRADARTRAAMLREAGLWHEDLDPQDLYLQRRDLEALPPNQVALGGHGVGHDLVIGRDGEDLAEVLDRVHAWLVSLRPRRAGASLSFAYPNGSHDDVSALAVERAGFAAAFTVLPWRTGMTVQRWALPRSCIPNEVDAAERAARGDPLGI